MMWLQVLKDATKGNGSTPWRRITRQGLPALEGSQGEVMLQWGPEGWPNVEARPRSHPQEQGAKENQRWGGRELRSSPQTQQNRFGSYLAYFLSGLLISTNLFKSASSWKKKFVNGAIIRISNTSYKKSHKAEILVKLTLFILIGGKTKILLQKIGNGGWPKIFLIQWYISHLVDFELLPTKIIKDTQHVSDCGHKHSCLSSYSLSQCPFVQQIFTEPPIICQTPLLTLPGTEQNRTKQNRLSPFYEAYLLPGWDSQ